MPASDHIQSYTAKSLAYLNYRELETDGKQALGYRDIIFRTEIK